MEKGHVSFRCNGKGGSSRVLPKLPGGMAAPGAPGTGPGPQPAPRGSNEGIPLSTGVSGWCFGDICT